MVGRLAQILLVFFWKLPSKPTGETSWPAGFDLGPGWNAGLSEMLQPAVVPQAEILCPSPGYFTNRRGRRGAQRRGAWPAYFILSSAALCAPAVKTQAKPSG